MLNLSGLITLALGLGLGMGLCASVQADEPRQLPLSRYSSLWKNSFMTTKPVVITTGPGPGALDEWALGGISEVSNGFLLTLFNRTNPQERRIIEPSNPGGFEVIQVRRVPNNYLATEVELRYKNQTGWVRYEEAMLTIKPTVQQGRQDGQRDPRDPRNNGRDPRAQNQPQGQQPQVPQPPQNGERRSRERTVPTPPTSGLPRR
jgi:hypothetical protein